MTISKNKEEGIHKITRTLYGKITVKHREEIEEMIAILLSSALEEEEQKQARIIGEACIKVVKGERTRILKGVEELNEDDASWGQQEGYRSALSDVQKIVNEQK